MERKYTFLRKLADGMDLPTEAMPGITVAELWGEGRVLVENHHGVSGYSQQEILVNASFGLLRIAGEDLELTLMTGDRMIVSGRIRELTVLRRGTC